MIPEPFEEVWRRIARWDAQPSLRIPIGAAEAVAAVHRSLASFAAGGDVLVDTPRVKPRPSRFAPSQLAEVVELHRDCLEFVVAAADNPGVFWAVTEEEYEYFVFEAA